MNNYENTMAADVPHPFLVKPATDMILCIELGTVVWARNSSACLGSEGRINVNHKHHGASKIPNDAVITRQKWYDISYNIAVTAVKYKEFKPTKGIQYLALTSELFYVYSGSETKLTALYNDTALNATLKGFSFNFELVLLWFLNSSL